MHVFPYRISRYLFGVLLTCLLAGHMLATGPGKPLPTHPMPDFVAQLEALGTDHSKLKTDFTEDVWLEDEPALVTSIPVDDVARIGELTGDMANKVAEARAVIQQVIASGRTVSDFLSGELAEMPMGFSRNIGGVEIYVALAEMRLKATHSEVDVFMQVTFPGVEDPLILGAYDVEFSRQGGFGDLNLRLLGTYGIDIAKGKSRLLFYPGDPDAGIGTYARITCGGVEELNLDATLILSREWAVPVRGGEALTDSILASRLPIGPNGLTPDLPMETQKAARVHWDFAINVAPGQEGGGFLIQTGSQDTFAITRYSDVHIYADNVALDFSDVVNPSGIEVPPNYESPYLVGNSGNYLLPCWRGVYIGGIAIQMPEQWRGEGAEPLIVYGRSILIDELGFTGNLGVENLLPLDEGNADGWAFSVDSLEFTFLHSQVQRFGMAGLINVPLLAKATDEDEDPPPADAPVEAADCLDYVAVVEPGSLYAFTVTTNDSYDIRMLKKSKVTIEESSSLDLLYQGGTFTATATLHGSVDINFSAGEAFKLEASGIGFNHLTLSNQGGITYAGEWDLGDGISTELGAFSLLIEDGGMVTEDNGQPAMNLEVILNIGVDSLGLTAHSACKILGEFVVDQETGRQRFVYRDFQVDALSIDASNSIFDLTGKAAFYRNDPVFGSGFYGAAALNLKALDGAGLDVAMQFGSKNNDAGNQYKYFFVDALVRFGSAAPPIGMFTLHGAGGGFWVNMRDQTNLNPKLPEITTASQAEEAANNFSDISELANSNDTIALASFIGQTLSGRQLLPDEYVNFGVKLTLVLATTSPNEEAMSINGTFQLEVFEDGGFAASIYGNASFYGPINWDNTPPEEGITALFDISYVNDTEGARFSAAIDLYFLLEEYRGTANGNAQDSTGQKWVMPGEGYAGSIRLYVHPENDEWYLWLGGTGTNGVIPPMSIGLVWDDSLGMTPIDLSLIVSGYFMVGTSIGTMPPLPDYVSRLAGGASNFMRNENQYADGAGIAFGASMDLTVKARMLIFLAEINAGVGFDINLQQYIDAICAETGEELGVRGWFAAGQAWAYLSGTISMNFRTFLTGEINLEILHAALAAVLQAKGPNPFWGSGRVGGEYRLLGGLIRGSFNMDFTVGEECTMVAAGGGDIMSNAPIISGSYPTDDNEGIPVDAEIAVFLNFPLYEDIEINEAVYELRPAEFDVTDDSGIAIEGVIVADTGTYELRFASHEMLPGQTTLNVTVSLEMWNMTTDDLVNTEERTIRFRTSDGYDNIPLTNVKASYPQNGMYNFFTEGHDEMYVILKRGQADLLREGVVATITSSGGHTNLEITEINYNEEEKILSIPRPSLGRGYIYELAFIKQVVVGNGGGTANPNNAGGDHFIGAIPDFVAVDTLISVYFRTSDEATFTDFVAEYYQNKTVGVPGLAYQTPGDSEVLGKVELYGTDQYPAIFQIGIDEDQPWLHEHDLYNNLYTQLPFSVFGEEVGMSDEVNLDAVKIVSSDSGLLVNPPLFLQNNAPASSGSDRFYLQFPERVSSQMNGIRGSLYVAIMSEVNSGGNGEPTIPPSNNNQTFPPGPPDWGFPPDNDGEYDWRNDSALEQNVKDYLIWYEDVYEPAYGDYPPDFYRNESFKVNFNYYLPGYDEAPAETFQATIRTAQ